MFVKFPDGDDGNLSVTFEIDGDGCVCATSKNGTSVVVYMTAAQFEALGKVLLGHVRGSTPLPLQGARRTIKRLDERCAALQNDRGAREMHIRSLEKEREDLKVRVLSLQSSVEVLGRALSEEKEGNS